MSGGRDYVCDLLPNVHEDLQLPPDITEVEYVKGAYVYYHYGCDGFDDRQWGCGYRTLMSLCSWVRGQLASTKGHTQDLAPVPSNRDIQDILVNIGDKEATFKNSKQWIGSIEASHILDHLYQVPSKILHVPSGSELSEHMRTVFEHFQSTGSPIMMGGNTDSLSKGIVGICSSEKETYLLVVDPHFWGEAREKTVLYTNNWVKWQPLSEFQADSFYNLCLPQLVTSSVAKEEQT